VFAVALIVSIDCRNVTCMAFTCKPDGLDLHIKGFMGDEYTEYKCPPGGYVELGGCCGI
jgi:hypothetical protein